MRNITAAIVALFLATGLLSCNGGNNAKPAATVSTTGNGLKIAYVNIDTLQNNLEFFKAKKAEFDQKEKSIQQELSGMQQNLQNQYVALQKAAQAGTLTQAEGEAKQRKLQQLQQDFQNKQSGYESQYTKELSDFNNELKKRLDDFLTKYNKDKHYDLILSDMEGGQILLVNPSFDITADVIKGMNEGGKNTASGTNDTAR